VRLRQASGTVSKLLGMKGSSGYDTTANDLFCDGQAGMNGVAVDPDFAKNRFIYVYSTSSAGSPSTNRVLRFTVNAERTKLADRKDIVTDIPYKTAASDHPFGGSGAHNGGRLRFGPGDGFLYNRADFIPSVHLLFLRFAPDAACGSDRMHTGVSAAKPWENAMSLERMILLVVGLIVVASVLLAVYHSPGWLWVTGIMGLHLVQAAFTGMCPVVSILKKMGLPERAGFA
jgi:hypothetical protein